MPAVPSPGRRYGGRDADERRAERRERLLDAALELIGTIGFPATTIRLLCERASVAPRYFYEHFASREELLRTVYDGVIDEVFGAVARAREEIAADDPERVGRLIGVFLRAMTGDERRARVCYLEVPAASYALEGRRRTVVRRFEALIEEEARGAEPDRDFSLTALALAGAANELLQAWLLGERRPPLEVLAAELSALFAATLATPPA